MVQLKYHANFCAFLNAACCAKVQECDASKAATAHCSRANKILLNSYPGQTCYLCSWILILWL